MMMYDTQKEHDEHNIDIVRELRLRRWARVHFVEEQSRKPHWHPVVLDEMQRCDSESASPQQLSSIESAYVPIAPLAPHFVSYEYNTADTEMAFYDYP